jgi:putative Ca2+/H+ antiporter (TMEM165/GDT1 family)
MVVALAEMGDKTQLTALILGLRYRRPWTVMLGILLATVLNHSLGSAAGVWAGARVDATVLGWLLGLTVLAFGVWTLVPDRAEARPSALGGVFFAEMGDKTQLATLALGARFASTAQVTAGTTLGMLVADGVAVFAGP